MSGPRTEGVAAANVQGSRPTGWWGMAVLVATESALFGTFVASYFYLRFQTVGWPPPGTEAPPVLVPLALAALLVAVTLPMAVAVRFARQGRAREALLCVLLTFGVGSGYLAVQVHRFLADLDSASPTKGAYESMFFLLSGAHHAHVLVGLLMCLFLVARLARGLTSYRLVAVEAVALYWYFLAAVAVVVVLTLTSPSL